MLLLSVCGLLLTSGCAHSPQAPTRASAPVARVHASDPAAERFAHGSELAARGLYVAAEAALSEALSGGYPAARVLPVLLEVCRHGARQAAGLQYALPYLQLNPGDFQLRYRVATLLLDLGQYERARSELQRVLDTAPNYARAHYLLALTLRDHFGDDVQAARHFSAFHRLEAQGRNQPAFPQRSGVL